MDMARRPIREIGLIFRPCVVSHLQNCRGISSNAAMLVPPGVRTVSLNGESVDRSETKTQ